MIAVTVASGNRTPPVLNWVVSFPESFASCGSLTEASEVRRWHTATRRIPSFIAT